MKFLKFTFIVIIFFVLGYVIGNLFPLGFISIFKSPETISGEAELRVLILDNNKNPISGLEVDIDKKLPPSLGRMVFATTDKNGEAIFKLKPGSYFVFFNQSNFPDDLEFPQTSQKITVITVQSNQENKLTVILKRK